MALCNFQNRVLSFDPSLYRFLVFSLSHSMLRFASPNDLHQTKQCRNFQYSAGTIVSNHGFGYGLYYWHRRRFEAPWGCPFRPCCAMRFGCTLLGCLSPLSPTAATPSLGFRCLLDGWHPQEASSSQGLGSFAVALFFYVFFYLINFFWPDGVLSTFSRPGWEQASHRGMPTSGAGRLGGHGDLVAYYEFLQYSTVGSLSVLQAALCILFSVPKYCISKNMWRKVALHRGTLFPSNDAPALFVYENIFWSEAPTNASSMYMWYQTCYTSQLCSVILAHGATASNSVTPSQVNKLTEWTCIHF